MSSKISKLGSLNVKKTLMLLCDIQEKFRPGMKHFDAMVTNVQKLVGAGKLLDVPLIATEHYPEKLGRIVPELDVSHALGVFPKTLFSMAVPEIRDLIQKRFGDSLESVILFGLESHICVAQTAVDFLDMGYNVHIVADCSMSRTLEDRQIALRNFEKIGCFVRTSESVIFDLMKDKQHPKFNEVRKLVRDVSVDTKLASSL